MTTSTHKRIASNAMYLYIRMLVVMGVSLYTVRIVLHALGVEDFGIYGLLVASVAVYGFIGGALSQATQRFLAMDIAANNPVALSRTFNAALALYIGLTLLVVLISETLGIWLLRSALSIPESRAEAAEIAFHFAVAGGAATLLQAPFNALIIAREKMWFFSLISVLEAGIKIAIAYSISHSTEDRLEFYSCLMFLASITTLMIYAGFSVAKFPEAKFAPHRNWETYRALTVFSGWNSIGSASAAGKIHGTNILLNLFFGPAANAAYGIMSQIQNSLTTLTSNLQTALSPQIHQSYGRADMPQMHTLIMVGSRASFMLLLIISAPLAYSLDVILNVWLTTPPPHTAAFIKGMLVVALVEAANLPLITAAASTGKIKWYQISLGGLLLLNLPLSALAFYSHGNPEDFLLIAFIVAIVTSAARLAFLRKMIGLNLSQYMKDTGIPIGILFLTITATLWITQKHLPPDGSLIKAAGGATIAFAATIMACLLVGMKSQERKYMSELFLRKIKGQ